MGGYAQDLSNIQNMIRDYVGGELPGRYCVLPKPEKTLNICKLQLQPLFKKYIYGYTIQLQLHSMIQIFGVLMFLGKQHKF